MMMGFSRSQAARTLPEGPERFGPGVKMKKALVPLVMAAVVTTYGCAGRTPNPVAAYELGDDRKSCSALKAELSHVDAEITAKLPDVDKTGRNVALGVAGAFFLVPWFFMDLSKADQVEVEALRRRHNNLLILSAEKNCGVEAQAIPDPTQVTPKAPSSLTASAPSSSQEASDPTLDPRMPRPGDTWKYQQLDGWNGQRRAVFVHQVLVANRGEIGERMHLDGKTALADEQVFTLSGVRMFERPLQNNVARQEFAPYLQALRGELTSGSLGSIDGNDAWRYTARVAGREVVRVPAGTFETVKVEIKGERSVPIGQRTPTRIEHTIWYAPKAKRYVRHDINSWLGGTGAAYDKERFELLEYRLK